MSTMIIDIASHEREAMQQLVLSARAFATVIATDKVQVARLTNWAQMVEDVLKRVEDTTVRQIISSEWGKAVKEFELRPGNTTEKVVSRIINRLDGTA